MVVLQILTIKKDEEMTNADFMGSSGSFAQGLMNGLSLDFDGDFDPTQYNSNTNSQDRKNDILHLKNNTDKANKVPEGSRDYRKENTLPLSTHTDKEGNVIAVFDDGDNGVYQHGKNADGGSVTEYQLSKRAEKQGTSSGGTKVGETAHWDEFVSPEDGTTMTQYNVQVGESFDPIISEMHKKAEDMDLREIASNSAGGGLFDIKKDYKNVGGLLNGKYATSRSAGNFLAGYAFFDYQSNQRLNDNSLLNTVPILFIVAVYDDVITQGHWLKVGKLDVREDLKIQPMQFIQDALNPENFELYDPNTGEITSSTKEECKGLESASVWEASHVEERIRDHYAGKVNRYVKDDLDVFND